MRKFEFEAFYRGVVNIDQPRWDRNKTGTWGVSGVENWMRWIRERKEGKTQHKILSTLLCLAASSLLKSSPALQCTLPRSPTLPQIVFVLPFLSHFLLNRILLYPPTNISSSTLSSLPLLYFFTPSHPSFSLGCCRTISLGLRGPWPLPLTTPSSCLSPYVQLVRTRITFHPLLILPPLCQTHLVGMLSIVCMISCYVVFCAVKDTVRYVIMMQYMRLNGSDLGCPIQFLCPVLSRF